MSKTDKELAVEIVCAYLRARCSRPDAHKPNRENLTLMLRDAYDAVRALPDSPDEESQTQD